MDFDALSRGPCPIGRGLARVGDGWSLLILRSAGHGLTRFDQFRAELGIAPNILTQRLKALTAHGLLETRCYSAHPPRHDYLLTAAGRDLLPVLMALGEWGRRHFGDGEEMSYAVDAETGRRVQPLVVDGDTGAPLGTRPLHLVTPDA